MTIFVVVACVERWLISFLANAFQAQETVQPFLDLVFRYKSLVTHVISHCKYQFTSKFWKAVFQLLSIKIHLSSRISSESESIIGTLGLCLLPIGQLD